MAAAHRVAVIGGGISGSVCAALLQRTGISATVFEKGDVLGGRASLRRLGLKWNHPASDTGDTGPWDLDHGAQFFTATDARFKMLLESPVLAGLVEEWHGRFGVLGSQAGHVLPRGNVQSSGMFRIAARPSGADAQDEETSADAEAYAAARQKEIADTPINFYGFLEGSTSQQLYTGTNGVGSLAPALLQRNNVNIVLDTLVTDLILEDQAGSHNFKWFLKTDQDVRHDPFDSVVIANQDPGFAADVIEHLQRTVPDPELSQETVANVISGFTHRLRGLSAAKCSQYCLVLAFTQVLSELPFDAVSVHNSDLQFLSRDSSKPGRCPRGVECWAVQPTVAFAASLDRDRTGDGLCRSADPMWEALQRLLGRFFEGGAMPRPLCMQASRWDCALFKEPLNLNAAGDVHNEAVTFGPWRLALCGDYLGSRQGIEEAALSGMMAADRVAQWVSAHG